MKTFDFTLKFGIPDSFSADDYLFALENAGCSDALVGTGQKGRVALHFLREANSAKEAVQSALNDVKKAIPEAELIEATPDLVGLSDIAQVLQFSRQYMRKLMLNNSCSFPIPVHDGKTSLWHLSSVLSWVGLQDKYTFDESLLDVALVNRQVNIEKELESLKRVMRN